MDCDFALREAKSHAIFEGLRRFCRAEATRNEQLPDGGRGAITWETYSKLLLEPNHSNFSPLSEAIYSGSEYIMETVLKELQAMRHDGHITRQQYASQFILTTQSGYTPMLDAIKAGNSGICKRIGAELFLLKRNGDIAEKDYLGQFACRDENGASPIIHAIKTGDTAAFDRLSRKLNALHREGRISSEELALQYTGPQSQGFTPLMEAAFTGNNKLFCAVADDLKLALRTAYDSTKAAALLREQLMARSTDNFNLFHCATWDKSRAHADSPNPYLLLSLIDLFYDTFGEDQARAQIGQLYQDTTRTERFRTPVHDGQPEWLKVILSLERERARPSVDRSPRL